MTEQKTASTKEVLHRNMTAFNTRDIEGYLANQRPDVEFALPGGITLHGRDEIRRSVVALWTAFPDGKLAFGEQVYAENAAAVEVAFMGTHTGPLTTPAGVVPPTGKPVALYSASILHIKDGSVASEHMYGDPQDLMRQLGLLSQATSSDTFPL
jgi:predicted ester cyclase